MQTSRIIILTKNNELAMELSSTLHSLGSKHILHMEDYDEVIAFARASKMIKQTPSMLFIPSENCDEGRAIVERFMRDPTLSECKIVVMHEPKDKIIWAFRRGAISRIPVPFRRTDIENLCAGEFKKSVA